MKTLPFFLVLAACGPKVEPEALWRLLSRQRRLRLPLRK